MSGKKVLLISANRYTNPFPVYPLALSYLSTYLKNRLENHEINVFDFNLNTLTMLTDYLISFEPDFIGLSIRNVDTIDIHNERNFVEEAGTIIQEIRKNSNARIIIGGAGFSIFPEQLFDLLKPDFGIKGEGEDSLVQLLLSLENNTDPSGIEGLVFRKENRVIYNRRKTFLRKLEIQYDNDLVDYYWEKGGMLGLQTKRGCPYHCVYCTYPLIDGATVRTLNIDDIVSTLSDIYHQKGINYVFFTDSVFNIENEYNLELAEKIIQSGIKINWGAYFTPHNMDEHLLKTLKKSGLTHIEFGTESICDQTLKNYNKHFTVADIFEKSELCNRLGIYFAHFLILGGYGETEDTINETFENCKKIKKTVFFPFWGMRIYPHTQLRKHAIREGRITEDDTLIEPRYYLTDNLDFQKIKDKAQQTGKQWIFPEDDFSGSVNQLREKGKKGVLWEFLIK